MKTLTKNPPDFPDNLPLISEAPRGKKWVYRGTNWESKIPTHYAYNGIEKSHWDTCSVLTISAAADGHYAELVDITDADVSSKQSQAELAKQWVLEGFEREADSGNNTWLPVTQKALWNKDATYRRKEISQEETDNQKAECLYETFMDGNIACKDAIKQAIQYGRDTAK